MTDPLAFGPCLNAPCAPAFRALCFADCRCPSNTGGSNENFISARGGLGDALWLHQQRQPESARENDRGCPAGLINDRGLPRRQPAALQLKVRGN